MPAYVCPECKAEDKVALQSLTWWVLTDGTFTVEEGWENIPDLNDDANMKCRECGASGTLAEFTPGFFEEVDDE